MPTVSATELARITQHFAATLSVQLQQLTDRGLYSSAVAADITERNERDRDEQIQMLNDRLMREKLENQHRLYEQQANMRARVLDGTDRVHVVKQEVHRDHVGQLTSKHGLLQSVRDRTLASLRQLLPREVALIGVGGICRGQDAVDKLELGASLVQFYTGMIYRGPGLLGDCLQAIAQRAKAA